jgi:DNA-directed RNA polymerase subunit F
VISLNPQIENNFKYHKADEVKGQLHDEIRNIFKEVAYKIDQLCPNSREKSLAITKLEESMMWANAAVARMDRNGVRERES